MATGTGAKPRLLVVEDEFLIAWMIEDVLAGSKYEVIGPAATFAEAKRLIESERLDGAVLDVQLDHGHLAYPLADLLQTRGVPLLFLTAYGRGGLARSYLDHPVVTKPFGHVEFRRAIEEMLNGTR